MSGFNYYFYFLVTNNCFFFSEHPVGSVIYEQASVCGFTLCTMVPLLTAAIDLVKMGSRCLLE